MSTEQAEKVQEIVAEGVAREGLQEMVLPAEEAAAKRLADFVSDAAIDRMIADAQDAGVSLLDGPGGLIGQLTARVIERALGAEMDDHLGYVKGDPAGNGSGNSRNGSYGKTLTTTSGPVRIIVPRDRKSVFEPQIVVKGQRRVGPGVCQSRRRCLARREGCEVQNLECAAGVLGAAAGLGGVAGYSVYAEEADDEVRDGGPDLGGVSGADE